MGNNKLVGIVLLVIGVLLLFFGWQSSQSVDDQVMEAFTGRFTETTTWYIIGGAVLVVVGGYLSVLKK